MIDWDTILFQYLDLLTQKFSVKTFDQNPLESHYKLLDSKKKIKNLIHNTADKTQSSIRETPRTTPYPCLRTDGSAEPAMSQSQWIIWSGFLHKRLSNKIHKSSVILWVTHVNLSGINFRYINIYSNSYIYIGLITTRIRLLLWVTTVQTIKLENARWYHLYPKKNIFFSIEGPGHNEWPQQM